MSAKEHNHATLKLAYWVVEYSSGIPQYKQIKPKPNQALYPAILLILVTLGFSFSTYGRCTWVHMEFGMLVCDFFAYIALTLCNFANVIILYLHGGKFLNKLILLLTKATWSEHNYRSYNAYIWKHVVFIAIIFFDIYVMLTYFQGVIHYYIFKYLQYYMIFSQLLLIVEILKGSSKTVQNTRTDLVDAINSFMVLPIAEMREGEKGLFTVTGWTKSALEAKASADDVEKVKEAAKRYKDVYLMAYYFNGVFGWPVLFVLCMVMFELIVMMDFLVSYCMGEYDNAAFLGLRLCTSIFFYLLEILVIFKCERVTEEVDAMANDTYRLILSLCECQDTIAERLVLKELMTLWYHIINNKPTFRAGFVVLRKKFIYGSFIGISSFIAVVVEFNRFVHDRHHVKDAYLQSFAENKTGNN